MSAAHPASGRGGCLPGWPALLMVPVLLAAGVFIGDLQADSRVEVLAGEETIIVAEAGLAFRARLDTGAGISSVHAEDIEVLGGDPLEPARNLGRLVRFTLVNEQGAEATLTSRIERVRDIRTGDCSEARYHVYLSLAHGGRSQRVLVNLNDRSYSPNRLLVGRNWLARGYLVDVGRRGGGED